MALANLYRVVQDVEGNVVPDVLGQVTLAGTGTLASLYSDDAGVNPLPNPLVNHAIYGSYSLFVGAGLYDMSFTKSGYTFETQRNIPLRDPAAGVNQLLGTTNRIVLSPTGGVGDVTISTPQDLHPDASLQFANLGLGTPATANALTVSGVTSLTPPLPVVSGGTGANNAAGARTNLGLGSIATVNSPVPVANGGTGATDAGTARVNLGLGTMATQNANAVAITGGGVSGITDLAIADGGTGASDAGTARNNLGIGTMGTQNANAVSISGGSATLATLTTTGNLSCQGSETVGTGLTVTGEVGIGATPTGNQKLTIYYAKAVGFGLVIRPTDNDTAGGAAAVFNNVAGTAVGSIGTNATSTSYNTSSDTRLKDAVEPLRGALACLTALRPLTYLWKATGGRGYGFAAHELQQVRPECVSGEPNAVDVRGRIVPQSVDHSKLVPWLTAAMQEILVRLEALEASASGA